ncbi:Transcription factor CP2 [Eumeta japonica]|uniref:Transcription factor CP2 n=1 Tax=Eumeta variegata TaxID=151549 RepID=A0A4C1W133_EUMVA|nr:Transcription factor CP2 [Eumeta japonica]
MSKGSDLVCQESSLYVPKDSNLVCQKSSLGVPKGSDVVCQESTLCVPKGSYHFPTANLNDAEQSSVEQLLVPKTGRFTKWPLRAINIATCVHRPPGRAAFSRDPVLGAPDPAGLDLEISRSSRPPMRSLIDLTALIENVGQVNRGPSARAGGGYSRVLRVFEKFETNGCVGAPWPCRDRGRAYDGDRDRVPDGGRPHRSGPGCLPVGQPDPPGPQLTSVVMLLLEQRLSARHAARGVRLNARLIHGVVAKGWRMRFELIRAEVELEAREPEVYRRLERRLRAANVHVRRAPTSAYHAMTPKAEGSPMGENKPMLPEPALLTSSNQMKQLYCQDSSGGEVSKLGSPVCHSPGAILPDLPQSAEEADKSCGLSKEASAADTQAWLAAHRFAQHAPTFANFSGADLLRLSREDIIQICGLADGIRLFNALHAKRIEPRLTVYVSTAGAGVYSALYLSECRARELLHKLRALLPHAQQRTAQECETVLVSGPRGVRVRLTDDLVRHLPDKSTYRLERLDNDTILLSATE